MCILSPMSYLISFYQVHLMPLPLFCEVIVIQYIRIAMESTIYNKQSNVKCLVSFSKQLQLLGNFWNAPYTMVLWEAVLLFQCATLAQNYPLFPCCQSSPGCKFDPTQFFPLRKCVPTTGQVRGRCGQAVIAPHITKVLWCQHNHIVCTVTTIWRAILLCQSFPIYGVFYVRKWMMARYVF